jgi:APA family basic amino acid/polyamine antiporter
MAGVAIVFGDYFREVTGATLPSAWIAVLTLGVLTVINCVGVRAGSNVQSGLMVLKILAIVMLIAVGLFTSHSPAAPSAPRVDSGGFGGLAGAMVPVLFAYGGWQTSSFVSGEMRNPQRDLPRGLLIGVVGVIVLYLSVNVVCILVLGMDGLAATSTPASEVMRRALGDGGARLIAIGIAVSGVGFLSQSMLTAPRVYYAMARDGVFFEKVGWLDPRTRVPTVAIILQGVFAGIIALSGSYDQILNYVESVDMIFFGLTGASLFIFRARARRSGAAAVEGAHARVPLHPVTTIIFVLACWAISLTTIVRSPSHAGVGMAILAIGAVVYLAWRKDPARVPANAP